MINNKTGILLGFKDKQPGGQEISIVLNSDQAGELAEIILAEIKRGGAFDGRLIVTPQS